MRKFNSWNNSRGQQNRRPPYRPTGKFDLRTDLSREILNSFTFRTVKAEYFGEDNDRILRRFKRVVEASGILSEIKRREYFKSNGQQRREDIMKSIKNIRKRQAKLDRMTDYDSKKINTRPYSPRRPQGPDSQS